MDELTYGNISNLEGDISIIAKNGLYFLFKNDELGNSYLLFTSKYVDEVYNYKDYLLGNKYSHAKGKLKYFMSDKLESHRIFDYPNRVYSLKYVNPTVWHRGVYSTDSEEYPPFLLPKYMNECEMMQILSYLYDKNNVCNHFSCDKFNESLDKFFDRELIEDEDAVLIDIFVVPNNKKDFKKSLDYVNYFDWYMPNISEEDIYKIYIDMSDRKDNDLKLELK